MSTSPEDMTEAPSVTPTRLRQLWLIDPLVEVENLKVAVAEHPEDAQAHFVLAEAYSLLAQYQAECGQDYLPSVGAALAERDEAERAMGLRGRCDTCDMVNSGTPREHAEARAERWEDDMMAEYGWYAHVVAEEQTSPTGFNAHTHGLVQTWDHPDLQVVARLGVRVAHGILARVVEKIRGGARYSPGDIIEDVPADGQRCRLIGAVECDRPVLRLTLLDGAGHLDPTSMEGESAMQYRDVAR